jgi:hypothetical protein
MGVGKRGIDRVQIALSLKTTVTIPWSSRQALLDRLRGRESLALRDRCFEAVDLRGIDSELRLR